MSLRRPHPLALCLAAACLAGCGETTFGGKGPQAATDPDAAAAPSITALCTDTNPVVFRPTGASPWNVNFTRELCAEPSTIGLHVTLLVDISYSMRQVDPPLEGRCGRLAAGQALVTALRAATADPTQVRLSLIHFGETAATVKQDVPLRDADTLTTQGLLCTVEPESSGFTNYAAAFAGVPAVENGADVTRAVYLITDGVPTSGGDAAPGFLEDAVESRRRLDVHAAAGLAAWARVSQGKDGKPWTLNGLFLGDKRDYQIYGFDPEAYLTTLTGAAARVAVVGNATALADAIVKLPFGAPGFDPGSATAVLKYNGTETPLTLASFERKSPGPSWNFASATFSLPDDAQILVTAVDRAGRPVQALTDIRVERPSESR